MNRRDALKLAASAALVSTGALAQAKDAKAPPPKDAKDTKPAAATVNAALLAATEHCVEAGEACLELAISLLAKGDTSMSECAYTTRAMTELCEATARFNRMGNAHLKELAAVCAKVCRDCEKACKRHELHHAECKECAQSCATCAAECEKLA